MIIDKTDYKRTFTVASTNGEGVLFLFGPMPNAGEEIYPDSLKPEGYMTLEDLYEVLIMLLELKQKGQESGTKVH